MKPLTELAERWRSEAEILAQNGAGAQAEVLRRHADQLEAAVRAVDDDVLDLAAASAESGLSADRLRHKIASGEIPNAGRKGAPRVRRGDLPRKARSPGTLTFNPAARAGELLRASRS